jgi:peptidoglycan/LPS O-acetylase OafA/YrhL
MYMLHLMGIIWLGRHPQLLEGIPFEWRFLLFLMALLTACAATFLLIEVPMRKLIRRRGRSRPAATPLPSSA